LALTAENPDFHLNFPVRDLVLGGRASRGEASVLGAPEVQVALEDFIWMAQALEDHTTAQMGHGGPIWMAATVCTRSVCTRTV